MTGQIMLVAAWAAPGLPPCPRALPKGVGPGADRDTAEGLRDRPGLPSDAGPERRDTGAYHPHRVIMTSPRACGQRQRKRYGCAPSWPCGLPGNAWRRILPCGRLGSPPLPASLSRVERPIDEGRNAPAYRVPGRPGWTVIATAVVAIGSGW